MNLRNLRTGVNKPGTNVEIFQIRGGEEKILCQSIIIMFINWLLTDQWPEEGSWLIRDLTLLVKM